MASAVQASLPKPGMGAVKTWTISLPPSWHQRHGRTATGGTFKRRAAEDADQKMMLQLLQQGWREPQPGRWTLMAKFYIPKETRDGDNMLKSLMDALKRPGALGVDDRFIRSGMFEVLIDKANPRCEFVIAPYVHGG